MTWDYIAGFIDGEGSFVKRKRTYTLYITQANQEVLEAIRRFIGGGYVYPITKRRAHWKDAWLYSSGDSKTTHRVLSNVVDRLVVKREQAVRISNALKIRLREIDQQKRLKESRVEKSKALRERGWSYRKIGRTLKTDWGYVRRLLLSVEV